MTTTIARMTKFNSNSVLYVWKLEKNLQNDFPGAHSEIVKGFRSENIEILRQHHVAYTFWKNLTCNGKERM